MSATLILCVLYVPCTLAVGLMTAAIGYALAVKRYSELSRACQFDQAEAHSSIEHLQGVTSDLSERVAQHSNRVIAIEQSLTAPTGDSGTSAAIIDAAAELRLANEKLQSDLSHIKRELEEQTKRLKREQRESRMDKATGFVNRAAFEESLRKSTSDQKKGLGGLAIIEIDDFKECNDRQGLLARDKVLQTVARVIRAEVVGLDTLCSRYGGGQFALIFHKDSLDLIRKVLTDIRRGVEKTVGDNGMPVTVSTGLVMYSAGAPAQSLEESADKALTAARQAGRNRTFICEGDRCKLLEPQGEPQPQPEPKPQSQAKSQSQSTRTTTESKTPPGHEAPPVKAPEAETVKVAEIAKDLAELAGSASRSERRVHKRQNCNVAYQIAPYIPGAPPSKHTFSKVRLTDVSGGGCGMLLSARPTARSYLVTISKPGGEVFLVAEVVRVSDQGRDSFGQPVFVVGCRFTDRISEPVAKLEAQTV